MSVLVGDGVDRILGGLRAFPAARLDDGTLHLAIVTADSPLAWVRALGRAVLDEPDASTSVSIVQGRRFEADLGSPMAWQFDGGDRSPTRRMEWEAVPAAVQVAHGPGAPMT